MTAAIRARAATTPDELALGDDSGSRTWAQVAADLQRAAGAMLAVASDPVHRVSVLGDNAIPTLEAHAAGLTEVILPERNAPDLDDVPADVRAQMTFHPVKSADEMLALALEPAATLAMVA